MWCNIQIRRIYINIQTLGWTKHYKKSYLDIENYRNPLHQLYLIPRHSHERITSLRIRSSFLDIKWVHIITYTITISMIKKNHMVLMKMIKLHILRKFKPYQNRKTWIRKQYHYMKEEDYVSPTLNLKNQKHWCSIFKHNC